MVRSGSFSRGANVMDILPVDKKEQKKAKEEEGEDKELMALCLKPFHNGFDRAVWFVEFVEYYRLMGEGNFGFFSCWNRNCDIFNDSGDVFCCRVTVVVVTADFKFHHPKV